MDGRRDETSELCHGQIASLAVLRTHRNLGYATQLMRAAGITSMNMILDEFKRICYLTNLRIINVLGLKGGRK